MQPVAARNLAELDEIVDDAFRDNGISDDAAPRQDERPEPPAVTSPEEFGLSADPDPEPDHEPMNGATITATAQSQGKPPADIQPFETFDASQWEGVPIEPREWIAHNRIPAGEPGIMSGDGGTGKTKLALQLSAAIAACLRDWVGGVVDAEGAVIVFSAEEKLKEMHRRTFAYREECPAGIGLELAICPPTRPTRCVGGRFGILYLPNQYALKDGKLGASQCLIWIR
jgi:AAA domain